MHLAKSFHFSYAGNKNLLLQGCSLSTLIREPDGLSRLAKFSNLVAGYIWGREKLTNLQRKTFASYEFEHGGFEL